MTLSEKALLASVAVELGLIFWLQWRLLSLRVGAYRAGEVKLGDVALDADMWPARARQYANSANNQFQLPMVFFTAAAVALATGVTDMVLAGLGTLFVISRLAHAWVHVTTNHVPTRFQVYAAGYFLMIALWLWLLARLLVFS